MNAKERAIDALEFFKAGNNVSAESVFNLFMEAVKDDLRKTQLLRFEFEGMPESTIIENVSLEPPLIQGYTSEQWQEIIGGGYLCEFSQEEGIWHISKLKDIDIDSTHSFCMFKLSVAISSCFKYCRPAQIKGVMRPIFVEPEDDSGNFLFFSNDGNLVGQSNSFEFHPKSSKATKYIEV